MSPKVLVAFASKYGSTAEIAEIICQTLRESGIDTDVLPADQTDLVSEYRAVVLGSAVYAGQWRKEAVTFLEANERALSRMPVWFFSSGPTGTGDTVQLMKGWQFPEAQKPIANRVKPRGTAFFHGVLDLKKLNFAERLIVRGFKAPIGDFRDWNAIKSWAVSIANVLEKENQHNHPVAQ
jgi:menaquinone-dependent protoporphyrinogen oxidase